MRKILYGCALSWCMGHALWAYSFSLAEVGVSTRVVNPCRVANVRSGHTGDVQTGESEGAAHTLKLRSQLPAACTMSRQERLVPQRVFLSKRATRSGDDKRMLYITFTNAGGTLFKNAVNPIAVTINGERFQGNIFAKVEQNGRYLKWVDILPRNEGAIVIDLPAVQANERWQQCEKLDIQIDADGQLKPWTIKYGGGDKAKSIALRLHKLDYASGCGHLE